MDYMVMGCNCSEKLLSNPIFVRNASVISPHQYRRYKRQGYFYPLFSADLFLMKAPVQSLIDDNVSCAYMLTSLNIDLAHGKVSLALAVNGVCVLFVQICYRCRKRL